MNAYVWKSIKRAASGHHPEGGLLVVAGDESRARELAHAERAFVGTDELPDVVYPLKNSEPEHVIVFVSAGCWLG